tara:strand:+ start:33707 stop:34228 length:522 start_codon:yes stop_codon:yes gene_type:complete
MSETLRIYVACLASYNHGDLHGEWIEVDPDWDISDLAEAISERVLKTSKHNGEEWAIHDVDSFCDFGIKEHTSLEEVIRFAQLVERHEEDVLCAATRVWSCSEGPDELESMIEERFHGAYDNKGEYAAEINEGVELPAHLAQYMNWEAYERDLELGGDITVSFYDGSYYIFSN